MQNLIKFLIIAFIATAFVACQEDDNDDKDPDVQENYYPMGDGSSWVYSVNEVDANNELSFLYFEKNMIDGQQTVDGKMTNVMKTYQAQSSDGFGTSEDSKNYYYSENDKVYASIAYVEQLLTFESFGLSFPLNTEEKFVKLLDKGVDSWDVIEIPYNNLPIEYANTSLNFTGSIKLTAKSLGMKSYSNAELSLAGEALAIEYSFVLSGNVSLAGFPAGTISIGSKSEQWYMNNVGMVKRVDSSVSLDGTGTIQQFISQIEDIPGNTYELSSYVNTSIQM
jgi:hypothetical protein